MTLTSALNSAMTGLTAASKQTAVVSDNVANALTPGYRRRAVELSTNAYSSGVQVGAVTRTLDPAIQKSVRAAEATYSGATVTADFHKRMSDLIGSVKDDFSLAQRLTDVESALIEATSLPHSDARLNDLSMQAEELVVSINAAADGLSDLRNSSEESIAHLVRDLQANLQAVDNINDEILAAKIGGLDTAPLEDQRDNLVDAINKVIPVQIHNRDNQSIALYTSNGVKLLDGSPAEINFDETAIVTPFMTIDNGMLSGLEIDGRTIDTTLNGALGGGEMAAHFHVRDVAAVQAQQDLDVFAGNLIERFQSATVAPTITAGQTGLFTDNNSAYDPANQTSISKRIQLNTSVSLSGDGETWRLRDGMHASGIGDKGDTTILNAYGDALSDPQTVSSNGIGSGAYSAYDIVSNILTHHTQETTWGENERAYASTIFQEMQKRELEMGVDTDAELQTLIVLERIYGANARMLRAIDEMLDQLMRI